MTVKFYTAKLYTLDKEFIKEIDDRSLPVNFTGIIVYLSGTKNWYMDGKRHRLDGHAIEWGSGTKEWFINGKLHRLDGPAYEGYDGQKLWYVNDKSVTELECKLLHDIMKLKGLL